jgi:hypothetical protein
VQRGESVQRLPTGLVRLAASRGVTEPDSQGQHVLQLVVATFAALGSGSRGLRYGKQQDIRFPRRHGSRSVHGAILWCKPSESAMRAISTTPAYAGAVVHGRRTSEPTRQRPGRRPPAMVRRPMAEWHCLLYDASPAYSSWAHYLAHQARRHEHAQRDTEQGGLGPGAPREGAALLHGLATGGLCGHRLRVAYRPRPRYVCEGLYRPCADPPCARLEGPSLATCVVQAVFDAMAPAYRTTLDEVLAQRQRAPHRLETSHQPQVSPARYDAPLARRRYEPGEPASRLAAAALEHEGDDTWRALRAAQEAAERFANAPCEPTLTMEQRPQRLTLSQRLPDLWQSAPRRHAQRKARLRSLIARVIVARTAPDRMAVQIVGVSGHGSQGGVIPPILRQPEVTGHDALVARLPPLWRDGDRDTQGADTLRRAGCRSARRAQVSAAPVLQIRTHPQWVSRYQQHRVADKLDTRGTIRGLARQLGVRRAWLDHRIRRGFLRAPAVRRRPPEGPYRIRDDAELLERLRAAVQRSRPVASASPPASIQRR